ncbi:hypothetical protein G7K71_16345 [Desulfofundulus sp. TPOSR]|uniref:hypothetical protein n=1 Tax=Desulfofundulus sp. TPOSR TaxID=2714340 RepID=UPI00140762B1|nr:hypothetical protein [Desulfofundulus sp. TPOSR]NHM28511.1 hypothetical protein [Desulfofundulus sp. TPOSR]
MPFEVYKPRGERAEKAPMVSFSKSSIVLNNVAREKLGAQHVELAYDRDARVIRIRAVEEGGMQIKKTKVFGKGFFKHFNISPRGKYEARFDENERALYVQLDATGENP